jgi:hypothetical protein
MLCKSCCVISKCKLSAYRATTRCTRLSIWMIEVLQLAADFHRVIRHCSTCEPHSPDAMYGTHGAAHNRTLDEQDNLSLTDMTALGVTKMNMGQLSIVRVLNALAPNCKMVASLTLVTL